MEPVRYECFTFDFFMGTCFFLSLFFSLVSKALFVMCRLGFFLGGERNGRPRCRVLLRRLSVQQRKPSLHPDPSLVCAPGPYV